MLRSTLTALSLAAIASFCQAGVVPSYTSFGALTGATFNTGPTGLPVNSGIPNNPTAITVGNGLTIGLTAFNRYQNPPISNNGAGVFYASPPGTNDGLGNPPQSIGTTWGFGYYINAGGNSLDNYQIDLFYDLDPSAGTMLSALGRIDIDAALIAAGGGGLHLFQDAQNLASAFFSTGNAFTTPPGFAPFDANAIGEYAFVLRVTDRAGVITESSILVDVVPEPGALALVGVALLGAAAASRRRRG